MGYTQSNLHASRFHSETSSPGCRERTNASTRSALQSEASFVANEFTSER